MERATTAVGCQTCDPVYSRTTQNQASRLAEKQPCASSSGTSCRIRVGDGEYRSSETVSLCDLVCPVNTRRQRNKQHSPQFDNLGISGSCDHCPHSLLRAVLAAHEPFQYLPLPDHYHSLLLSPQNLHPPEVKVASLDEVSNGSASRLYSSTSCPSSPAGRSEWRRQD